MIATSINDPKLEHYHFEFSYDDSNNLLESDHITSILEKIRKMEEVKLSQCEKGVIEIRGQQYNFFGNSSENFVLFNESDKAFWLKQTIFSLLSEIKKRLNLNSDISVLIPPLELKISLNANYSKIISLGHIWGLHNSLFYPNQFYSVIEEESVNFESRLEELINLSQNISSASVSDGYESEDERDYDLLEDLDDQNLDEDELSTFDEKCKSASQDSKDLSKNLSSDDKLLQSPIDTKNIEGRKIYNIDADKSSDDFLNFYTSTNLEYLNDFPKEYKNDLDNLFDLNVVSKGKGIEFSSKKRLTNECAEADRILSKRKKYTDEDTEKSLNTDELK